MSKPNAELIAVSLNAGGGGGGLGGSGSGTGVARGEFSMLLPGRAWEVTGTISGLQQAGGTFSVKQGGTVIYQTSYGGSPISFSSSTGSTSPWTFEFETSGSGCCGAGGQASLSFDLVVLPPPLTLPTTFTIADQSSLTPSWQHALAWSARTNRFIRFGGRDASGDMTQDMRAWAGAAWTEVPPATTPPARADHALSESPNGYIVLFGGQAPGHVLLGDTWRYDATGWVPMTTSASPSPRGGQAIAFDRVRNRAVMFGGFTSTSTGTLSGETWTFNGVNWTLASTTGPSPRFAHAMAYDKSNQRVVLFGGYDASGWLGDTWTWNGTSWSPIPGPGPSPRFYHSMQADHARGGVLLVGGRSGSDTFADQWMLTSTGWSRLSHDFLGGPVWTHAAATSPDGLMLLSGGADAAGLVQSDTWQGTRQPVIVNQPDSLTLAPGDSASFEVEALGSGLVYQWTYNGSPLSDGGRFSGVATPHLVIAPVTTTDAGDYACLIANAAGAITSAPAGLGVSPCDTTDFNRDGLFPDTQDIDDFLVVFSGGACSNAPNCGDIDFNNDGLYPDTADIDTLLRVFSGGPCEV